MKGRYECCQGVLYAIWRDHLLNLGFLFTMFHTVSSNYTILLKVYFTCRIYCSLIQPHPIPQPHPLLFPLPPYLLLRSNSHFLPPTLFVKCLGCELSSLSFNKRMEANSLFKTLLLLFVEIYHDDLCCQC